MNSRNSNWLLFLFKIVFQFSSHKMYKEKINKYRLLSVVCFTRQMNKKDLLYG